MQRTKKNSQRGTAMIEMSLVMPILVLFSIGIIELGQALTQLPFIYQTVFNSVYSASRTASNDAVSLQQDASTLFTLKKHNLASPASFTFNSGAVGSRNAKMSFSADIDNFFTLFTPIRIAQQITVAKLVTPPDLKNWVTRSN